MVAPLYQATGILGSNRPLCHHDATAGQRHQGILCGLRAAGIGLSELASQPQYSLPNPFRAGHRSRRLGAGVRGTTAALAIVPVCDPHIRASLEKTGTWSLATVVRRAWQLSAPPDSVSLR